MYEYYIFAWKNYPKGGAFDLIRCADSKHEAELNVKRLIKKYDVVQLMSKDGTIQNSE